ncbi:MAG: amidohydrolase [Nocardioidaceae bacterium]
MPTSHPDLHDEIDRLTKSIEAELIEFRRDLHRHPELGRQETRTTSVILERLLTAGLEPRVLASGTGVICDIIGSRGEPATIGFRGDIDALPLNDVSDSAYRSTVAGVCHACGHDAHTAVVLGTALVLADLVTQGALERSVRLIFQPAEEVTPGGALDVLADGGATGLEQVFALHCDPKIEVGRVGFRAGAITAGADRIKVTLRGPGGHTARPHLTADLVYALGAIVTELPAVLSRLADPRAALSLVWGQAHAGAAANAIPQEGYAEGTIRCLDASVWESAHTIVPDLVRQLAAPYGVDVDVDMHTSVPPCVNDEVATAFLRSVAADLLGAEAITDTDQSLGGEDFGWILGRVPGALARLGVRNPEVADAGDLHQGSFDIDESAIGVGVRLFCAAAVYSSPV